MIKFRLVEYLLMRSTYLLRLTLNRCRVSYGDKGVGIVSENLYSALTSLQMGLTEDKMGWTVELN